MIPGRVIATHGTPHAAASITEQPQPSATEVDVVSPGPAQQAVAHLVGLVAVEGHRALQAQVRDERLQACPLRPVADDVDPQPRERAASPSGRGAAAGRSACAAPGATRP